MNAVRVWTVLIMRAMRYFAYRMGVGSQPTLMDIREEITQGFVHVFRWRKRLRIVDGHLCVPESPAIIAGNHISALDPFIMYRAVEVSTQRRIKCRFMMREGVFRQGSIFKCRLLDLDEISQMAGTFLISREHVQLSQLKPFIKLLREHESFIIFPGRTRSRTGLLFEYRDGIDEPGSVSFFIVQARRGRPELRIAAVPLVRTVNPMTKVSSLVFGKPWYLPEDADRAAQRDFDFSFVASLGDLVEISALHLVALILYLRCLHSLPDAQPLTELTEAVAKLAAAIRHRHLEPAMAGAVDGEVGRAVRWLAKRGMLRREGGAVVAKRDAILAVPPSLKEYGKSNPIKHLVNQILHMSDVVSAAERTVLPG